MEFFIDEMLANLSPNTNANNLSLGILLRPVVQVNLMAGHFMIIARRNEVQINCS